MADRRHSNPEEFVGCFVEVLLGCRRDQQHRHGAGAAVGGLALDDFGLMAVAWVAADFVALALLLVMTRRASCRQQREGNLSQA